MLQSTALVVDARKSNNKEKSHTRFKILLVVPPVKTYELVLSELTWRLGVAMAMKIFYSIPKFCYIRYIAS